ncbi:hypothetical protein F511_30404 [Dorcoceras hygrometricum]|uniref:Uncharacterized protein n=1 Tax=Dorcoceras hygrometricum TaxID=472368 RepID=A0A2Z7AN08_9LAMI|nr:hypothetical protein F511_30404 [Dorcoceras hygrometricum]
MVLSNLSLLFRGNIVEFRFDKISDLEDLSFRGNERSEVISAESTEYITLISGILSFVTLSEMASSLVSNTNQVHFASVLAMDNSEMVAMFEALVASGLNRFLGWKLVDISEEMFVRTFQLPVEGLIDINEVPKDLIFYARTEFSFTDEQLSTSCKKRELKIEYSLLSDIVAKLITVKTGSFDVTHERFLLMTAIFLGVSINWGRLLFKIFKDMVTPETRQARGYAVHICILLKNILDLELGDSEEFPPLKILTDKTVGRYLVMMLTPSLNKCLIRLHRWNKQKQLKGNSPMKLMSEKKQWLRVRQLQKLMKSSTDTVAYAPSVGEQQLQTFVEPEVAKEIEMETVLADHVITKSDDILVEVDVLKHIWLFGSVQILGTVYSEVSYSGRSIVGSIGHSVLSNNL